MGVIKRQSIKNSLVNYLGVLIGAISVIFIYPQIHPTDLGIIQFTLNTAILFAPIAAFSSNMTAIQYYPLFKDEKKQDNGFFLLMTGITLITAFIFIFFVYIFSISISTVFGKDKIHFINSLPYILLFTVFIALSNLYQSITANFNRIVIPSIFQNLLLKITQPLLILSFAYGFIAFADIFKGLSISLSLMVVGLLGYLFFLRKFNLTLPILRGGILSKLWRKMVEYASFNILVTLGSIMAMRIDQILVAAILGFQQNAVFSFGFFISEAIDVPRKALSSIAAPLISESIMANRMEHVAEIYRKSALIQLIVGAYILAGTWACADALFDLMPKNAAIYREGKYVILFLGLSRVLDMATGPNTEIITLSQYYRFNFVSFLAMAVLNTLLNFLLIPMFGIEGSAIATLLSIIIINIWRLVFIKNKLGFHPLSIKMLIPIVMAFIAWLFVWFIPTVSNPIFTIFIKASILTLIYWSCIYYFSISEDVNALITKMIRKFVHN